MPSAATQTALHDVPASASMCSPREPIPLAMDWQQLQRPSWLGTPTRRGGMKKKENHLRMKHSWSQTEGGMYNAAAWETITAEYQNESLRVRGM